MEVWSDDLSYALSGTTRGDDFQTQGQLQDIVIGSDWADKWETPMDSGLNPC